ncbi:hypothetical protein J7M28_11060 [bacterium]|nr:hypothetical protein [bacterium]
MIWLTRCLLGLMVLFVASIPVFAESLTYDLTFPYETVSFGKMAGYDLLSVKDCDLFGEPGEPLLPSKPVYISLPPGFEVTSVRLAECEQVAVSGKFNIAPAQPVRPISRPYKGAPLGPAQSVYSSSSKTPPEPFVETGQGSLRGYSILSLIVFPLQYVPSSQAVFLNKRMTIEVRGNQLPVPIAAPFPEGPLAGDVAAASLVRSLVVNPKQARQYPRVTPLFNGSFVDVLIISPSQFVKYYVELADWLDRRGLRTEIVTMDEIATENEGRDGPERMRNRIKDYYHNRGLGWVILGGEQSYVPTRVAFAFQTGSEFDDEDRQQCDYYFSDLDRSWNEDGDELWGEYSDDRIDMFPDVFVGRIPARATSEAERAVERILAYESAGWDSIPTDYLNRYLFWGCELDARPTWGGDVKDKIISDGYLPTTATITTCYDRDGTSGKDNIIDAMNRGYAIINNVGHSNYNVTGALHNAPEDDREYIFRTDISKLKNAPRYSILYTVGCWFGAMDKDSLGERFLNCSKGGAIAALVNSRYGWYSSGSPGGGPSDLFDREFFKVLFNGDHYFIGETFALMKTRYISYAKRSKRGWFACFRWVIYGMNLLGTPTLPVWTKKPTKMAVEHPAIYRSKRESLEVVVADKAGRPIEGARVCLTDSDRIMGKSKTDEYGVARLSPGLSDDCTLDLTVTAHNFFPYMDKVIGILNVEPELESGQVVPIFGSPKDTFTFKVHYADEDGDEPVVMKVKVGDTYHDLALIDGDPFCGTFGVELPIDGQGCDPGIEFHFLVADGHGSFVRYPEHGRLVGPGFDVEPPSSAASTSKYASSPAITVNYTARDDCSGVDQVQIWFRFGGAAWRSTGLSGEGPTGQLEFLASEEGLYEFYSTARDNAGNDEARISRAQTACTFDVTAPSSRAEVDEHLSMPMFSVHCTASDALSGVNRVILLYRFMGAESSARYAEKEAQWTEAEETPWHQGMGFEFEAQDGPGLYEFMTLAVDNAGNVEHQKDSADASSVVDFDRIALWLSTPETQYRLGDEIVLSAGYENWDESRTLDLYIMLTLPDSQDISLPGMTTSVEPFYPAICLPAFSTGEAEVLTLTVPADFASGPYTFWAAFFDPAHGELFGEIATFNWDLVD